MPTFKSIDAACAFITQSGNYTKAQQIDLLGYQADKAAKAGLIGSESFIRKERTKMQWLG